MAGAEKVTITLPAELLEGMKAHTDDVSGYLTELAERAERRRALRDELARYQDSFGAFTDREMAEARALLHGAEAERELRGRVLDEYLTDCESRMGAVSGEARQRARQVFDEVFAAEGWWGAAS
ncbi:hypothetical protein AB0C07_01670 [Actinoplanes missouriensis]|uniref:hypothetical protein n=1 Tax=Actinoplanes missouriensis TaxID=1866 RepID=UPI00340F38A0